MKRIPMGVIFASWLICGLSMLTPGKQGVARADEPAATIAVQADHDFVQAAAKGDVASVGRYLDAEFTWTTT